MVGTQSIKHNQEGNVVHYHGHVAPPHVVDVSKVHFYYFNFYESHTSSKVALHVNNF